MTPEEKRAWGAMSPEQRLARMGMRILPPGRAAKTNGAYEPPANSTNYGAPTPDADGGSSSLRQHGAGKDDEPPEPLELIRPVDQQDRAIPARRWIVPNWIPYGEVTGLYGHGGLGKTLLVQQLQTACAIGKPWIGQATEPVRSLAMYCEDDQDELSRRQRAFNDHYGCDFRDLGDAIWLARKGKDNLLIVFTSRGQGELTVLHKQFVEAALDLKVELAIVDGATDTFGGNEIIRPQVQQYVAHCLGSIALAIRGAVVVCAHPSRAGITSGEGDGGSTGWHNAFRSRGYLNTRRKLTACRMSTVVSSLGRRPTTPLVTKKFRCAGATACSCTIDLKAPPA